MVKAANGIYCAYYHLSRASVLAGMTITAGQQVGLSGATGNVTGPHLHYQEQTGAPGYYTTDRAPQFNTDQGATVLTLVDASTSRPTPAAVKAAGHAGIIGYVSDYPAKNITKAECQAFIAAGLSVSLVWENGSQDAYGGFAAGVADGKKAVAQAQALGYPKGCVLFAAADSNAAIAATVGPYFQGWAQTVKAAGFLDGAYGDAAASHLCTYSWKVETWGTGDANIVQMVNAPIGPMPGTDIDEILHDFPRWDAAFIARAAASVAPTQITQTFHELVMQIHETPASNEWGRRARIAYNLLKGQPGALTGHVATAEPIHIANARNDLAKYIPTVSAGDQWGRRARLAYNALRGIN
jgi:hypothetical protein